VLPSDKYFAFSERYMFADRDGPKLLQQGASYIHVQTSVTV
jgi:hypothetical protein